MPRIKRDYYELLGIEPGADPAAIKNAFRTLAMQYHPDRNKSPEAEERFKQIAEAYAILSDPAKRRQYDAGGFAGVAGFSPEDLFADLDFGDIFRDMGFGPEFGQEHGSMFDRLFPHQPRGPTAGHDIEVQMRLSLDTINTGGDETIQLSHPVTCPACRGSGAEKGTQPVQCNTCQGSGKKVVSRREHRGEGSFVFQQISECPDCHGKGVIIDKPCKECHGRGQVEKKESLKINIPAGAEEGMALRVQGHGMPGPSPGGPPGNLYVIVHSKPDERFKRRGADLWRDEIINIEDAVLGCEIEVPTLDKPLKVKIPPGTQPDETVQLKGQGLPYFDSERRGDLNLTIHIHIPKQLNAEQRKLFKTLRELNRNATDKKHRWP